MNSNCQIRKADPIESGLLSSLALRSKAYWGYSDEFIELCKTELTYPAEMLKNDKYLFIIAEDVNEIIGFYAIQWLNATSVELEALFVEPKNIGKGYGRVLLKHAVKLAAGSGAKTMNIQSEPNAEQFYISAGGKKIGECESSVMPGRYLPLYEILL